MQPPTSPRKTKTAAFAWAALAVVALAGFVPLAAAEAPERAPKHDRPDRELPGRQFSLSLDGTLLTRDNETLTFTIEGKGRAHLVDQSDNVTKFRGRAKILVQVFDENGTLLREGRMVAQVGARCNLELDQCRWRLESVVLRRDGFARLVLRGEAEPSLEGGWDLSGHGRVLVKPFDGRPYGGRADVTGVLGLVA